MKDFAAGHYATSPRRHGNGRKARGRLDIEKERHEDLEPRLVIVSETERKWRTLVPDWPEMNTRRPVLFAGGTVDGSGSSEVRRGYRFELPSNGKSWYQEPTRMFRF